MKKYSFINIRRLRIGQTPWENRIWMFLRGKRFLGYKFKRQVPVGKYIVDFCCQEAKLIIELDGAQHNDENEKNYDEMRDFFLESKGYKVLRFWNNDIDKNLEGVLEVIKENLNLSPDLSPRIGERKF